MVNLAVGWGSNRFHGQGSDHTFSIGSNNCHLGSDTDDTFLVTDGGNNLLTGSNRADAFWITTGELISNWYWWHLCYLGE